MLYIQKDFDPKKKSHRRSVLIGPPVCAAKMSSTIFDLSLRLFIHKQKEADYILYQSVVVDE